mmetsp:Transcript_10139/g.23787  ORF Transcript_10139/g.23787 Transcript_10139/m.23787 type:complete len:251 (+) Transcript_10139:1565-2317(+)
MEKFGFTFRIPVIAVLSPPPHDVSGRCLAARPLGGGGPPYRSAVLVRGGGHSSRRVRVALGLFDVRDRHLLGVKLQRCTDIGPPAASLTEGVDGELAPLLHIQLAAVVLVVSSDQICKLFLVQVDVHSLQGQVELLGRYRAPSIAIELVELSRRNDPDCRRNGVDPRGLLRGPMVPVLASGPRVLDLLPRDQRRFRAFFILVHSATNPRRGVSAHRRICVLVRNLLSVFSDGLVSRPVRGLLRRHEVREL